MSDNIFGVYNDPNNEDEDAANGIIIESHAFDSITPTSFDHHHPISINNTSSSSTSNNVTSSSELNLNSFFDHQQKMDSDAMLLDAMILDAMKPPISMSVNTDNNNISVNGTGILLASPTSSTIPKSMAAAIMNPHQHQHHQFQQQNHHPIDTHQQQYAELQIPDRHQQHPQQVAHGHHSGGGQQVPPKVDDGYGSQTAINVAGFMDSPPQQQQDDEDDFSPFMRSRCNTWPRRIVDEDEGNGASATTPGMQQQQQQVPTSGYQRVATRHLHHHPYQRGSASMFSPNGGMSSRNNSGLSLISESNESLAGLGLIGVSGGGGGNIRHQGPTTTTVMTSVNVPNDGQRTAGQWLLTPANLDERSQEAFIKGSLTHMGSQSGAVVTSTTMATNSAPSAGGVSSRHSSGSDASDVSSMMNTKQQQQQAASQPQQQQQQPQMVTMTNYKAGHPSYVELITQAIGSSVEKRMTLSEIYDWMVANVPAFKDQRYLHSSSGWKNSVRHNLSLHSRFKRVKRNGMDKPSWWTVDLTEEVKRERTSKRPAKANAGGGGGGGNGGGGMRPRANTTTASIYHPPQQQQQQQMRSMANNATQNRQQSSNGGQQQQQMIVQHQQQHGGSHQQQMIDAGRRSSMPATAAAMGVYQQQGQGQGGHPQQQLVATRTATTKTVLATGPSMLGLVHDPHDGRMEWTTNQYLASTKTEIVETTLAAATGGKCNLNNLSQAITVTLCDNADAPRGPDGQPIPGKPDIALTITVGDDHQQRLQQQQQYTSITTQGRGTTTTAGGSISNLVQEFRQNTLEDMVAMQQQQQQQLQQQQQQQQRQLLRVKTNTGHVQEVAVPVPMPIRVVTRAHKDCQTETDPMLTGMPSMGGMGSGAGNNTMITSPLMTSPPISNLWLDTSGTMRQDELVATLDELMAMSEMNGQQHVQQQSSGQQQYSPNNVVVDRGGAMSPSEMLNAYFPTTVDYQKNSTPSTSLLPSSTNSSSTGSSAVNSNNTSSSSHAVASSSSNPHGLMPEDLQALEIRDAFDCNIMDILSFDMNCGTPAPPPTSSSSNSNNA